MSGKRKRKIPYIDLENFKEDQRIQVIGQTAMDRPGVVVGLVTNSESGKAERYIAKIQEWFPQLVITHKGPGPVAGTTLVKLTRPVSVKS